MSWPFQIVGLLETRMSWAIHAAFRIIFPNFIRIPYGSWPLDVDARENAYIIWPIGVSHRSLKGLR